MDDIIWWFEANLKNHENWWNLGKFTCWTLKWRFSQISSSLMIFQICFKSSHDVIHCVCRWPGDPEKVLRPPKRILSNIERIIDFKPTSQKIVKIIKNPVYSKNSNFEKSSLVLQYHDILQEIDPPDVLDVFWSHIDYQNIFRIDFGKIDFFPFLTFWFVGQSHKNFKIYRFGYKKT